MEALFNQLKKYHRFASNPKSRLKMIDEKTIVSFITNMVKIIVIMAIFKRHEGQAKKKVVMPTFDVMKGFWGRKKSTSYLS